MSEDYSGYSWIKVKRAKAVPAGECPSDEKVVSEAHHIEETTFLIEEVRKLAAQLEAARKRLNEMRRQSEAARLEQTRRLRWEQDSLPYYEDDRDGR
jgi:hypothetical protein